jgi:hypothetical protein
MCARSFVSYLYYEPFMYATRHRKVEIACFYLHLEELEAFLRELPTKKIYIPPVLLLSSSSPLPLLSLTNSSTWSRQQRQQPVQVPHHLLNMRALLSIIICLALGLVGFVHGKRTHPSMLNVCFLLTSCRQLQRRGGNSPGQGSRRCNRPGHVRHRLAEFQPTLPSAIALGRRETA